MVLVPALSDRLGCKPVMVGAMVIALSALWMLPSVGGTQSAALCALLFVAAFMNTGVLAINVGPVTHGSVPERCVTTATGVVVGVGEVFGGAAAPAMAGTVAQRLGIV